MKNTNRGFKHLMNSTLYSLKGLRYAFTKEAAFRQELLMFLVLFPASFFLAETLVEWAVLIAPLFLVLTIELINSAIEALADKLNEIHPLIGAAKDMGSAAIFIMLVWTALLYAVFVTRYFYPDLLSF